MKIFEQYIIKHFGELFTIRLYNTGEHRCSCNHFAKITFWGDCPHIKAVKNYTATFIEMRRMVQDWFQL